MKSTVWILLMALVACEEQDATIPVDPELLNGPLEIVVDKSSLCPAELVELKLLSYSNPGPATQLPILLLSLEPISPEDGKIDENGFFTAPPTISATRFLRIEAKLRAKPEVRLSLDLELVSPDGFGAMWVHAFPIIPIFGSGSQGSIHDINKDGEYLTGPPYISGPTKDIALRAYLYDSLRQYKNTYEGHGIETDFVSFFDERVVLAGVGYSYEYLNYLFDYNGTLIKLFNIPDGYYPLDLKKSADGRWFFLTKNDRYSPESFRVFEVDQEMNFDFLFELTGDVQDLPSHFPLSSSQFLFDFQISEADDRRVKLIDSDGAVVWERDLGFYGPRTSLQVKEMPNGNLILVSAEHSASSKSVRYVFRELDRATGTEVRRESFLEGASLEYVADSGGKSYGDVRRILVTDAGVIWALGLVYRDGGLGYVLWNSTGGKREVFIADTVPEISWKGTETRFDEWGGGVRLTVITPDRKIDYLFGPNLEFNPCR